MNYYHLLFCIHLATLLVLTAITVRHLFIGVTTRIAGVFLLVWANLVYTGLILSAGSQLGNRWLYFGISLVIAFMILRTVLRSGAKPMSLVTEGGGQLYTTPTQRVFICFLLGTLGIAALCTLILCVRYQADNWDTLAHRYARVFLYLGHGNLLHFAKAADFRALYYPFNIALAYLLPAIYTVGGVTLNCFSFLCWCMVATGVYLLARVMGASKLGALVASWLCAMAPIVLCEGASTNDDILAAAPALLGLTFFTGAVRDWNRRCLVFAALGFGLGVGTKLHWVFFLPPVAILLVTRLPHLLRQSRIWLQDRECRPRLAGLLIAAGIAAPLGIAFLACNYISNRALLSDQVSDERQNIPFRLDVAWQKIRINSAQLFLSSVPDLEIHFDPAARKRTYEEFDQWTNQHWFQNVNQNLAFRMRSYPFQGVADPTGYSYNEQTLWPGFLPILMVLLCVAAGLFRFVPVRSLICIAAFFGWHLAFAASTRYMETIGSYYTYPTIVTCAGLGLAFDTLRWRKHIVQKLLILGFGAVVLTHLVIDFNLLAFNSQRNMPTALRRGFDGETSVTRIAEPAVRAIRSVDRIHIPYTHWEVLYWNFMRHNPRAHYTTGAELGAPDSGTLSLISMEAGGQWLIGRSPGSGQTGLTYLGESTMGYVFGAGANVDIQNPGSDGYFLVPAEISRRPGGGSLAKLTFNTNAIHGLEKVEFRAVSESSGGHRWTSPWMAPHTGFQSVETPSGDTWREIVLESRSTLNHASVCEVRQTQRPFSLGECDSGMVLAQMGSDLAFGKTATQSSTVLDAPAGRAVDKDTNGNLHDRSVTHTNSDANAWWQVDLGKPATVRAVKIWNRTDCCGDRLSDYWVFVSNTPFTPAEKPAMLRTRPSTWNSHQTTVPRPSTTIFTGGIQGQYVRVQLTGTGYLSLAEVEVKGADENVPAGPMAKSAAGEFRVVLGPKVWAPEAAQYRGQTHMIRWLSNETEFTIANNSAGPREVIVSASLATYPGPRHAYLVLNGTKLPEIQEVKNMFWIQGPQLVQFRARLKAGENRLSLRTDEPAGVLPGNRPVALALLEDLHVESPRTAGR